MKCEDGKGARRLKRKNEKQRVKWKKVRDEKTKGERDEKNKNDGKRRKKGMFW